MLSITNLSKRYDDVVALDQCSFEVEPGRMLGFLGRNGAGKTTTMRAIFGLVEPDAGTITWRGRPVTPGDRLGFGYMPEERGLYPKMGVADQLVYLGRLHGMSAADARAATARWLDELELGDRTESKLQELSQGNQQRVQLAAALLHSPEVLVLDEPFNGLDPISAQTMARVLRERAAAGAAVVFSSHQLEVVEDLCEDVAIIHDGRIRLTGHVDDLKAAAPHRVIELDLTEAQSAVLGRLDGVIDTSFDGRHHRLRVARDINLGPLLATVDPGAGVDHFVFTTPSLTELFTEAVR